MQGADSTGGSHGRGHRAGRDCEVPERAVEAGCGEVGAKNGESEWRGGGAE